MVSAQVFLASNVYCVRSSETVYFSIVFFTFVLLLMGCMDCKDVICVLFLFSWGGSGCSPGALLRSCVYGEAR